MNETLEINDLTFGYRKGKKEVFHDFSLSLQPGKVYGLLGRNGTGKSTLLYLMSGLLTPRKGSITYRGLSVRRRLPATLQELFLVPEEFELPSVSLVNYVELNAPFYPRFSREDLVRYLHYFDMTVDVHLGRLSMGQKKKVFMSFALATHASLLLMDEPTNGLDIPGKSQFRKLIASGMDEQTTLVISTHQVRDVERTLDHVLIVDESRVLLDASTADICRRLAFVEGDPSVPAGEALYAMPSAQGHLLLLPARADEEETELNLELLFHAVLAHPETFSTMFHPQAPQ